MTNSKKNKVQWVTQTAAAAAIGVSRQAVAAMKKRGQITRNRQNKYNLQHVIDAHEAKDRSRQTHNPLSDDEMESASRLANAKKKEAFWKAERAERIFKKEASKLISREELISSCTAIGAMLHSKMMNWQPSFEKYMTDEGKMLLKDAVRSLLDETVGDLSKLAGSHD